MAGYSSSSEAVSREIPLAPAMLYQWTSSLAKASTIFSSWKMAGASHFCVCFQVAL